MGSGLTVTNAQAAAGTTSLQTTATVSEPATQGAPVTIHYQDSAGHRLAPDQTLSGNLGTQYRVPIAKIAGYVLARVVGEANGEFTVKSATVTMIYERLKTAATTPAAKSAPTAKTAPATKPTDRTTAPAAAERTSTPRTEPTTRAAATTTPTAARISEPTKGVEVLGKYPVRRSGAAATTDRLPQTDEQSRLDLLGVGGLILLISTATVAYGVRRQRQAR